MAEARTFYGGEPVTGAAGGEIGAGKYDGPEAHLQAPWDCPACKAHNEGPLHLGCVSCGAGKPGYHVGLPPPGEPPPAVVEPSPADKSELSMYAVAEQWVADHPLASPVAAFVVGYELARQQFMGHTMQAPPVTVDLATLAPETKAQRTIIAALELFRDQVLGAAEEEIASGEWCSLPEVAELIQRLKDQL
jgi:hypothetical protein